MAGLKPLLLDDATVTDNAGNIVEYDWISPTNGNFPQHSIGISRKHEAPYIVQEKTEKGYWIVTTFTPITTPNPVKDEDRFFLVAKKPNFQWSDYDSEDGKTPDGRLPCEWAGQHGRMYVGMRTIGDENEIGMVALNEEDVWIYYTDTIEKGIMQGFQILCVGNDDEKESVNLSN